MRLIILLLLGLLEISLFIHKIDALFDKRLAYLTLLIFLQLALVFTCVKLI